MKVKDKLCANYLYYYILSLFLTLYCSASAVETKILFTKALVYDAVIQGAEVKGYLSEYGENYDSVMYEFEEQAVALCANAVMEFSYYNLNGGNGLSGSGVAVCDPRLGGWEGCC